MCASVPTAWAGLRTLLHAFDILEVLARDWEDARGGATPAPPGEYDVSIAGQSAEPSNPLAFARGHRLVADAVDPARRESIASVFFTPPAEIPGIVARARLAARSWSALPAGRRTQALAALRRLISQQTDGIAETIARSMGKPLLEALSYDVAPVLSTLDACIEQPPGAASAAPPVVCVIAPISLPFERALVPAIMALAAGSAVVIKPASSAALLGGLIASLFEDAFPEFPALAQVVQGGAPLGSLLATAEGVDRVIFSGARASALRLQLALEPLQRSAELEPLAAVPLIVCDDANLERAANASVFGRFCNNGQGGGSVNRIYVQRSVAAEFARKVVHKVRALKAGPYTDAHCELGPLASAHALPKMRAVLQDAIDQRAVVLTGGMPPREIEPVYSERRHQARQGFYWPATVLTDVAASTRLMREETLGPILAITAFEDEREAIALANEASNGFGACIFSGARERAARIASGLRVRRIAVNDVLLEAGGPSGCWQGGPAAQSVASDGTSGDAQQLRVGNGDADRESSWFPYSPAKLHAVAGAIARLAKHEHHSTLGLEAIDG